MRRAARTRGRAAAVYAALAAVSLVMCFPLLLAALVPAPRRPLLAYHGVLAPHAAWRGALVPAAAASAGRLVRAPSDPEPPRAPGRWSWATLLRRGFAVEVLGCPRCAGPRRIVGAVTEPHAVRRLLTALGLAAEPPPPGIAVEAAS